MRERKHFRSEMNLPEIKWKKKYVEKIAVIEEPEKSLLLKIIEGITLYLLFSFGVLLLFAAFRIVGFILSIFINFNSW